MRGFHQARARAVLLFLGMLAIFGVPHIVLSAEPQPDRSPLPALAGQYVFPSTEWKALKGADLASTGAFVWPQGGQEISLRVHDIRPGLYYLRVDAETGAGTGEEQTSNADAALLFLNGKAVSFGRATPIVPFEKTNVAVIESQRPLLIQNGDEVRWNVARRAGLFVGGVALSQTRLAFAPVDVSPIYDTDLDDQVRLSGGFTLPDAAPQQTKDGQFSYSFTNVTGQTEQFTVKVTVLDYWERPVATQTDVVEVNDRADYSHTLSFALTDSDRYRAIVHITAGGRVPQLDKLQEYEKLTDNPDPSRPKMWMNDGWQWVSIKDNGTAATRHIGDISTISSLTGWQAATLPASWYDSAPQDHLAWYKRGFTLPAWFSGAGAGRRMFLHIERASEEARVFVNGVEVGKHFGHGGPFEFEVTSAIRPGSNEIEIGLRDGIATLEDSALADPVIKVGMQSPLIAPQPVGPGLAEMWLYGTSAQPVHDVFVTTSFRQKKIALEIQPPAMGAGQHAVLSNSVLYQGKEVLRFADVPLTDSSPATVNVEQGWPNPILWNPGDPKLLQLVTEVKDGEGRVIDRDETRFGFREFWPDGVKMMWNGQPIKLVANAFLQSMGGSTNVSETGTRDFGRKFMLASKRFGIYMHRHVCEPEYRIEMSDEEGIPIAWELNGISGPTEYVMQSDEYWKNAAAESVESVLGMRDHPSIVTWYLSNEFHGADTPPNQVRLRALGKAVAAVDTSRILEFGCDLDLGGFSPIISTHYPVDVAALYDEHAFFPDAAYWHPMDEKLVVGEHVPDGIVKHVANVAGESKITWGGKPIVINETLWNYFFSPPDGLTRIAGDAPYASPAATETAIKTASAWFMRGDRDADAAIIEPWEWIYRDPVGTYLPPVDINPIQRYAHFFGGRSVSFDVNLEYDRFHPASLVFVWKLVNGSTVLQKSMSTPAFESGDLKRVHIEVNLPAVKQRAQMQLRMALLENGAPVSTVNLPMDVCPHTPVNIPSGVRIGLYDPAGTTRKVMASFNGTMPSVVSEITSASLDGLDVLVIGENAAGQDDEAGREALDHFVRQGGRLLVLRQDAVPMLLPVSLKTTGLAASQLWSFYPGDAFFKEIGPDDFSFWYPGHRVGGSLYVKPDAGNFRTLLDSGGPKGMVYSALIEHPDGKGSILCSQLDLTTHLDENPIAGLTWNALLKYTARRPEPQILAGYWGGADFAKTLDALHADLKPVHGAVDLGGLHTVILDGARAPGIGLTQDDISALHQFVAGGGQLLIHGVTPGNRDVVSQICGGSVQVFAAGPHSWDGRAIHTAQSDFSAGLTNYDLFWRHRPDTESYAEGWYRESSMLAPLGTWTLAAQNGLALTYPSYLVEVPVKAGRILLDNIAWETTSDSVRSHAQTIGSVLLTDLGVRLDTPMPLRIPQHMSYQPVDLSSVLNRSFIDDKALDGQGGWTDQGPDNDLRGFPVDKPVQVLGGVPFKIDKPKSILVLASPYILGNLPTDVDLPFSGKAGALFFLQSEAWTGTSEQSSYTVHYADGSSYEIKVAGGINIRDWADGNHEAPFPFETDTKTSAAWTGSCAKFPSISLYDMAWPNPHPNLAIQGITFHSMKQGIPILVALTAGISNGDGADSNTDGGQTPLKTDPGWVNRHMELGYISDGKENWLQSVQIYKEILAVDSNNLEALFRIGTVYEKLERSSDAEATYRHSLEISPNQPDVLRALHQLLEKQ